MLAQMPKERWKATRVPSKEGTKLAFTHCSAHTWDSLIKMAQILPNTNNCYKLDPACIPLVLSLLDDKRLGTEDGKAQVLDEYRRRISIFEKSLPPNKADVNVNITMIAKLMQTARSLQILGGGPATTIAWLHFQFANFIEITVPEMTIDQLLAMCTPLSGNLWKLKSIPECNESNDEHSPCLKRRKVQ